MKMMNDIFRWMYEHKCTIDDMNNAIKQMKEPNLNSEEWYNASTFTAELLSFIKHRLTEYECE